MTRLQLFILSLLLAFVAPVYAATDSDEAELTPVTIKLQWQHQFQFAGIYTAIEKGFYRQQGLDVTIETGYTHPYDEVESGKVQFGLSGTGIVAEYLKGRPFVALGATFQNSPYTWLVRSDSGIYSVSDFEGKTVTRQSYADDLAAIFLKENIDLSKINFVPTSANDIDDLITGKVDAITAYVSNEPFFLQQRGIRYRTIRPKDYGINFYSDILFTTQDYAKHNPERVKAFREATYQGWRYAYSHQNEIINLVYNKYNPQQKSLKHVSFEASELFKLSLYPAISFGHMSEERWQLIAQTYKELGLFSEISNLDNFIYHPDAKNEELFKWLALIFALVSIIVILGYLLKKHHNSVLQQQIQRQTSSIETELLKREKLELGARQEQLKLQTLLDNTIDSVITINQHGVIEQYNRASELLFGYPADEVMGRNITMLMPESYRDRHKLGLARFLSTETSKIMGQPVELAILHKSGSVINIELTISAFKWEGQYLFIGIGRDISKHKAEQKALLEAKLEAERANNAKSEFLSAMSHEIRTPLNGILGFSQLLLAEQSPQLSNDQLDNVHQIIHSGEHLLTLINDVLELAKIESGNIITNTQPILINNILDECLPMLETLATKHVVTLHEQHIDEKAVLADFTKLKQVFINLVINAIKYNKKEGDVFINTEVGENKTLKLIIADNGQGIAQNRQDKVFTSFQRLGQEYADIEGSGVGLSVSKRLIEAMNGGIGFTSEEGKGSSFWIELPLANETSYHKVEENSQFYPQQLTPMRRSDTLNENTSKLVLYVEDNPANVRLMQVFFTRLEHVTLHSTESAEAAFEFMKETKPDLVLMDINLTGMSGLDAARIMHESDTLNDIPVIALTAAAMQENIDAAEGLFKHYLTKPIDFNLLSKTLQSYL